ncbi:MAG: NAD(P)/FAD-dependent oxidoreductase [Candidatus Omnitrophota bacterium]
MSIKKTPEVLIIGATDAGFAACRRLAEARPDWKITLLSQEEHLPYSGGLLPDYLEGKVKKREIFLCEETFFSKHNVEFLSGAAVSGVDFARQRAFLRNNRRLAYDYLIIAGGRKPVLDIPGKNKEGVFIFFGFSDAENIKQRLSIPGNVVVCGEEKDARRLAGFSASAGREVKLVLEASAGAAAAVPEENPEVISGMRIEEVIGEGRELRAVRLSCGKIIEAASVFFCCRGNPCLDFAAGGPVTIENGFIPVDAGLRAGADNIFACGDICIAPGQTVTGITADDARAQGARAADGALAAQARGQEAVV